MGFLDGLLKIAAPVIGAAGSLFGGSKDREAAEQQQFQNYLNQKEFAQMGIRWRVEDAKAAGLHPLYALQGSGATFSPNPIVTNFGESFSRAGQDLGRAASALVSPNEKAMTSAQLEVAASQAAKNWAEASYWSSAAARGRQGAVGTQEPAPITVPGVDIHALAPMGQVVGKELPEFGGPHITDQPAKRAWDVYTVGPNVPMLLPSGSNMAEALESVSESTLMGAAIIGMNAQYFGPGWLTKAADHFGVPASKLQAMMDRADRLIKGADAALHPRQWMERGREYVERLRSGR